LALRSNSECLGMSAFFLGITETVPSLFCPIFSERNSVPNPKGGEAAAEYFGHCTIVYLCCLGEKSTMKLFPTYPTFMDFVLSTKTS
jgi:hypothetical protein